jgi:hypothetical protein
VRTSRKNRTWRPNRSLGRSSERPGRRCNRPAATR